MEILYIRITETALVLVTYLILKAIIFKIIEKTLSKKLIHPSRGALIRTVFQVSLGLISLIFISLIWGVKQSDLAVFIGSVLTVVGVALFAQWSLLSNVTASIIIFFNHPVKLNDTILILEGKDYTIKGKVTNIGLFFVSLETEDAGELTLPNNVFISKSIKNITQAEAAALPDAED